MRKIKTYILESFDILTDKYSWEDESTSEMVYSVKSFRDILEFNIDLLISKILEEIPKEYYLPKHIDNKSKDWYIGANYANDIAREVIKKASV